MGTGGLGLSRSYPQTAAATEYVHAVVVVVAVVTMQE